MANVIKTRKGLDINLAGKAERRKAEVPRSLEFGVSPEGFPGLAPKLEVRIGDMVKVGTPLFSDKLHPEVTFASPVSGMVSDIVRGERRKVIAVKLKADEAQDFIDFGRKDVSKLSDADVKKALLGAGLFGYVNQLPYAVVANPEEEPKAIFVSALRDMPLAGDFEYELQGQEDDFQAGLTALSKVAKTYLGIGPGQKSAALVSAKDVEVNIFDGPCPAGNPGVQANHISPVNKGETVWTVDPSAVIFFGRLFNTGMVNLTRTVAIAGSEVREPLYVDAMVGTPLTTLLDGNIGDRCTVRIIQGNPLTGAKASVHDYLWGHTSEITAIPEGDDADELLGWAMPRLSQLSTSRSYFSWLLGKGRKYSPDARIKGGERKMIMSGEYDRVLPMDILGEYLIKAIIAGDVERMEQLGIYEVSPEDFAVAEFVDSSKLELQRIVRQGLDMLRKENS